MDAYKIHKFSEDELSARSALAIGASALTERYLKISDSNWFKEAYRNRAIGESITIE